MEKFKTLNTLKGSVKHFDELVGRILCCAEADGDELKLYLSDTNYVRLYHSQDCCESVYIDDICGDLDDLVGEPLLVAEEVVGYTEDPKGGDDDPHTLSGYDESYTWTFYRFATRRGWVTVKWYGSSNGYYSEGVSVDVVDTSVSD
jgi:hypothetical protein